MTSQDIHTIRHGYNLADLHALALASVRRGGRSGFVPARECYEAAWSAIAEHLVIAEDRPEAFDLIRSGMRAIAEAINSGTQTHGWNREDRVIRPGFAAYWIGSVATHSPEERIVDSAALWQIWPQLTEIQRHALLALATHGDYRTAAAASGVPYGTFCERIRLARIAFLALWHEGEAPSRVWSVDRRRWRDGSAVCKRRLAYKRSIKEAKARRKAAA